MSQSKNNKYTDVDKEALRLDWVFDKGINFKDRIIQLTGEIETQTSFDYMDAALTEMERGSKKAITIKINSPGGSPTEALAIVGRLRNSKCQIVTEVYGEVMSAAVLILAAGDKRRMSKYAVFMHHESSYSISGEHSSVKDAVERAEREEELWSKYMQEFTEKDTYFWKYSVIKKNMFLDAYECYAYGVIDEIF